MTDLAGRAVPSLKSSLVIGGVGFGVVSLCVFATVAFGERWMYTTFGVLGAYIAWTTLFILLGGAVLGSLVVGRWRLPQFYILYGLAFFFYSLGWFGAYFTLRGNLGEWVGSLVGSASMAYVFALGFLRLESTIRYSVLLFVANSAGYFLGSLLNNTIGGRAGMLVWGAVYGLGLGTGISAVLHFAQGERRKG